VAFAQSGELPEIAVYVIGDLNENEKRALEMEMLNTLLSSRQFSRGNSAAFAAEMEKKQTASSGRGLDNSQISLLGVQFGLRAVCIVEVVSAFGSHQISAQIINVRTAETRMFGRASGNLNSMEALETLSASVVSDMLGTRSTQTVQAQSESTRGESAQTVQTQSTQVQAVPIQTGSTLPPKIMVIVEGHISANDRMLLESGILDALLKSGQFVKGEKNRSGTRYACLVDVRREENGLKSVSARIMDIETHNIVLSCSRFGRLNSRNEILAFSDVLVNDLLRIAKVSTTTARHHHAAPAVQDFTGAERLGTWFLNTIIPGIGSAIIMKDANGFFVLAGTFAIGCIGILNGFSEVETNYAILGPRTTKEPNVLLFVGVGSFIFYGIYNVVRSAHYTKPVSQTAAINNHPQGLNFAVLPEKDGNVKAYAVYNIGF
jgi:hypothetical protein